MTVTILLDTARQAGLECAIFPVEEIGWDGNAFVGPGDRPLSAVFKLYPWERMVHEEFGQYLEASSTLWIESARKMLLSNKGILPVLWELFPWPSQSSTSGLRRPGPDGALGQNHCSGAKAPT